ncbi:hypothetical protein [Metamycoplasma hyosynoviae]|uniref:hypothetical protein n=1 Tax=Metamycoplasma hyosynoviae TaxID=29559 RepID=UPI0023592CB9|nr:hypothetical protein [Metamycoplasma hyosynoviae]MDC8919917.1 hypothetical protein [Metamycoplasma hyosynoviae]MDC8920991.1 hypothetical protein [Metamycoplasma hyosynoviae]MDD1359530.1 hypothetical protein [Metamycoplasma hyosynoviae]MDD1360853.1 hypothetical protein [Metamycoplasma hyosynoviae]MDD1361922.1 hypothetical protein [Metamycoplasma hyosynoviae]
MKLRLAYLKAFLYDRLQELFSFGRFEVFNEIKGKDWPDMEPWNSKKWENMDYIWELIDWLFDWEIEKAIEVVEKLKK